MTTSTFSDFGNRVVAWQKKHGRHDLPWQNTRNPYAVWLSEIMLQQTQVVTVCDYFARFLQRFPTVQDLALAPEDAVLGLWSGLGYYSRARNLHRAAQQVVALHGGQFPSNAHTLQTLPGIGPSTAAAVASLCFGEAVPILDGNVKRVLTRFLAYPHDLSEAKHERALWDVARQMLPTKNVKQSMPIYTQGVMDLGATVCTPKQPACERCPLQNDCQAHAQDQVMRYPVKSKKLKRSAEQWWLLWAQTANGAVWLVQRPATGVWASLYCLPMFNDFAALAAVVPQSYRDRLQEMSSFKHVLTHKDLHLHVVRVRLPASVKLGEGQWHAAKSWPSLGLPAPVRKLLAQG